MTNEEAIQRVHYYTNAVDCDFDACDGDCSACVDAIGMAIAALRQPEVIRCKDCKHWRQPNIILNGKSAWSGFCKHMDGVGDPEGFCYRAERGEEG